jgi:aryl-alcohol dehydrogenase-like predicted oxidoreductase
MSDGRLPSLLTTATGEPLSRVGLGTVRLGDDGDAAAKATLRRAIERGINWVDTDAVFGFGDAERLVGELLADLPQTERPFVATGVGFEWDGRSRRAVPRRVVEPRRLRLQLQRSLSRLGLEAVDLLKLNFADGSDGLFEDAWSVLLDLKQAGLTRAIGLVAPDSASLERAERIGICDAVHVELSLIDRRVGDSELPWRREPAPAVIATRPLAGGQLVADRDAALVPAARQVRDLLAAIGIRRHASPAAVAVAWSLAWPGIAAVTVGARTEDEVDAIAEAEAIELSVRDLSDIANLLSGIGSGFGPVHPRRFARAA